MSKRITINQQNDNISFSVAFTKFIRKCEVKNLTEKSIISYQQKIRPFEEYLTESHLGLSEVDAEITEEYIPWLKKNREANDITVNSYLRTVRAFLYFCMNNGWVPRFQIHLIKAVKKTKETYTNSELSILLKKPNIKMCDFTEYKVWAFENFMVGTGVRLSTATAIKIKDIDFDSGFIFLGVTKNRKQQYVPLAKSVEKVLLEYLDIRGGEPDDYVFCNARGGKVNDRTMQQMVFDYNKRRGVDRTSIHAFRHTFAKLSILNGMDPFRLQKLMGHSNISVTREYVELFGEDLSLGYEKFNPLDNLMDKGSVIKMNKKR